MGERSGVMFYFATWKAIENALDLSERGELMTAAMHYAETGEVVEMSEKVETVFLFVKIAVDQDLDRYDKACKRRKAASEKANRVRWGKSSGVSDLSQTDTNASELSDMSPITIPNTIPNTIPITIPNTIPITKTITIPIPIPSDDKHDGGGEPVGAYISKTLDIPITGTLADDLRDLNANGINDYMIRYAVDIAVKNGAKTWAYALAICQSWIESGINSLEAAKEDSKRRKEDKGNGGKPDFPRVGIYI